MTKSILFVDDEKNVIDAIRRQLYRQFDMHFAVGAENALTTLAKHKSEIAVIVSDLRMPKMDGFAFLKRARMISADSILLVLTGNADVGNAIKAVNEGSIFRFLTKPCDTKILVKTLNMALEQYQLVTAEKDLLENTLRGSVEVLTDLLTLTNPEALGHSFKIKDLVSRIGFELEVTGIWQLETAAMLSQIGWITLPHDLMDKIIQNEPLDDNEEQAVMMHPMIASDLLDNIPRMEEISRIVAYQEKHYDGSGFPRDGLKDVQIPLGARVLKIAMDFVRKSSDGKSHEHVLQEMRADTGLYDPHILKVLGKILGVTRPIEQLEVGKLEELEQHMIIDEEIRSISGKLLMPREQKVSQVLIKRLTNFQKMAPIQFPIKVRIKET